MDAFDILHTDGADNAPGIELEVLWNFRSNITAFPALPASPTTNAERTTLAGTYTCTTPFERMYIVAKTGMIEQEDVAGNDGGQRRFVLKGRLAGNGVDVEAFLRVARNSDLVFAVPQIDGVTRILGGEKIPAKIISSPGGSKKVGDQDGPGFDIEIECFDVVCPRFEGTVPIS